MKIVGEIERVSRTGWYFFREPTFHIPCLLAVGRYSEADSELCGALSKVAHFRNVPKTIRDTVNEDSVDPDNCIGVHATVDGPYGPVQYIKMREFDWCPHCIEALAHEITHAVRSALIDRNVYMGSRDRACETFSYVFSSLFLGFLEQLEERDGWAPTTIIPISSEIGCAHNKKGGPEMGCNSKKKQAACKGGACKAKKAACKGGACKAKKGK